MFKGKTVMITGAGKNIGKEIALDFARNGANVIVCDYNREYAEKNEKENIGNGLRSFIFFFFVKQRKNFVEQSDNNACQHTGCQDI